MSIFKTKKIIFFSFLILLLISVFIPFTSHAAISIENTSKTITSNSITFNGHAIITPGTTVPNLYFYYAKTSENDLAVINATRSQITLGGAPLFSFTKTATNLIPNTNYTVFVTDASPSVSGTYTIRKFWDFKTLVTGAGSSTGEKPQTVITNIATAIYPVAATLSGNIVNENMSTRVWFKYGTNESTLDLATIKEAKARDGTFSKEVTGLTKGTTYYFRACAENSYGETCGNVKNFYTPDPTVINSSTTTTENKAKTNVDYYPLANLPGIGETCEKDLATGRTICVKTGPNCEIVNGKEVCSPSNAFANYLNALIKLCIGLAAVLAMIMIVMGGIEYMTSELVSSKQAGKQKILHAVLGLLLALGSYAILNTLNPELLNLSLSNIPEATLTLQDETETTGMTSSSSGIPPSSTPACSEGFEQISTVGGNFWFCKKISQNVKSLINSAWSQNPQIKLSGGSYRSTHDQEMLRSANCGGSSNVYNKNATCHPLTAYPGTSRHENGLAIDFTCEGSLIQHSTNKCFIWLKANAESYGIKNLLSEPWHWSNDGH
ncbi:MAG: M15 family metallopeptidase [Minisyncoccia bacterium]